MNKLLIPLIAIIAVISLAGMADAQVEIPSNPLVDLIAAIEQRFLTITDNLYESNFIMQLEINELTDTVATLKTQQDHLTSFTVPDYSKSPSVDSVTITKGKSWNGTEDRYVAKIVIHGFHEENKVVVKCQVDDGVINSGDNLLFGLGIYERNVYCGTAPSEDDSKVIFKITIDDTTKDYTKTLKVVSDE